MSEHPNLKVIYSFFDCYNNGDMEGIKKVMAEDIKWHIPGNHPLSGTKNGIQEVMNYFDLLSKGSFRAEHLVMGVNDHYVLDCHRNISNIANMENFNQLSCLLWKIEHQKIIEVFNFPQDQASTDAFFNQWCRTINDSQ